MPMSGYGAGRTEYVASRTSKGDRGLSYLPRVQSDPKQCLVEKVLRHSACGPCEAAGQFGGRMLGREDHERMEPDGWRKGPDVNAVERDAGQTVGIDQAN